MKMSGEMERQSDELDPALRRGGVFMKAFNDSLIMSSLFSLPVSFHVFEWYLKFFSAYVHHVIKHFFLLGFTLGIIIALKGILGWKNRHRHVGGGNIYFQKYRLGSSSPIVLGALIQGIFYDPAKNRKKKSGKETRSET